MAAVSEYKAPQTLDDAFRIVAPKGATLLAGGTDLLPRWARGLLDPPATVVDLKRIVGLEGIEQRGGEVRIAACTVLNDIHSDAIIRAAAPVLAEAAGRIACPQIRNRATVGGNLCNASPAADTAIPLILLDAVLELASATSDGPEVRDVPVAEFFKGPGSTVLAPGEILTCIRFKPLPAGAFAAWDKFGTRPAMEIAVASVGIMLMFDDGIVGDARVGFGSVAPVPLRGRRTEAALIGNPFSAEVITQCEEAARQEIAPISDVRASSEYRREMVGVMLRRMLERAKLA
jgi:xanthine dehydrogenase FAD-binding subunit